jgi:hypothetical protein
VGHRRAVPADFPGRWIGRRVTSGQS